MFGCGAVLLPMLVILSYLGANLYFDRKIQERLDLYNMSPKENVKADVDFKTFTCYLSFLLKISYVTRIDQMDEKAESYVSELVEFFKKDESTIINLTNYETERYGTIETSDKGLYIKSNTSFKDDLNRYLSEILAGNFSNKDKLYEYFENPEIFVGIDVPLTSTHERPGRDEIKIALRKMIEILEVYDKYNRATQTGDFATLMIRSKDGRVEPYDINKLKEQAKEARRIIEIYLEGAKSQAPIVIGKDFLDNKRIIYRFHTHPINEEKNHMASGKDKANTYLYGPEIMFSQNNGTLYAVLSLKGHSREIYKSRIDKNANYRNSNARRH
jgi:hypothetical protein